MRWLSHSSTSVSTELGALSSSSPKATSEGIFMLQWYGELGESGLSPAEASGIRSEGPGVSGSPSSPFPSCSCPSWGPQPGLRLLQAQPTWKQVPQVEQSSGLVHAVRGCSICQEFKTNNKIDCKSVCFLLSPCQQFSTMSVIKYSFPQIFCWSTF